MLTSAHLHRRCIGNVMAPECEITGCTAGACSEAPSQKYPEPMTDDTVAVPARF
jgi:hypothetical protein